MIDYELWMIKRKRLKRFRRQDQLQKKYQLSIHHIIAKEKGGTDEEENKVWLQEKEHQSLHRVFWNSNICMKIKRLLEIEDTALQWDFKRDILRILELYNWDVYHKSCYKKFNF